MNTLGDPATPRTCSILAIRVIVAPTLPPGHDWAVIRDGGRVFIVVRQATVDVSGFNAALAEALAA